MHLYADQTFALEYWSPCVPYAGTYSEENGAITFTWDTSSSASGILTGQLLTVRYNDRMIHSDFENAVYTQTQ